MSPRSRVTIREVAARAGVSHQTISRVINGSERVSPETRARVEAAIAELGFSPNAIARFMAQGRTHTFACLSPNLTDYTFASIIEGAEMELRQNDFFLLSASAPDEATFDTLVKELVMSSRTEALMVINPFIDGRHNHLPENVPTVFLGARPRENDVNAVSLDEIQAGQMAASHLLALGHKHVAHITGPLCEDCSQDRQQGYRSKLSEGGIVLPPELVEEGDWSATSGYNAAHRLLQKEIPFTAVFAQNDRMAVGAIRAFRDAGLKVPDDISVIGFDDMPLASYFDPPLTTIRQDNFEMGREAARLLLQSIENANANPLYLRLPGELIVRASTGPVNSVGKRNL